MRIKPIWLIVSMLMIASLVLAACGTPATEAPTTAPAEEAAPTEPPAQTEGEKTLFGILLVGPYNDHGWSRELSLSSSIRMT